jgi:hypothetical protein
MTPDFVIIGAQKGGTTFLYDLLGQHPHVLPAMRKEIHYFDRYFDKGTDWYLSRFPTPTWRDGRRSITGEATPYYLFHPHTARRMAQAFPQVRLIALLRDPVDRAHSSYRHQARQGRETLEFEEALEAEETRLRGERDRMLEDEHYASFNHQHFTYLSRGIYVDQLMEWSKFFSRDQMHVLKNVLDFLGLPDWEPEATEPSHAYNYPGMSAATRQRLCDYFEAHNRRLYAYLGEDFGW